jgi:hypothetical protein
VSLFEVSTSEDSCLRVCVRFLEASARALVSNMGFPASHRHSGAEQGVVEGGVVVVVAEVVATAAAAGGAGGGGGGAATVKLLLLLLLLLVVATRPLLFRPDPLPEDEGATVLS